MAGNIILDTNIVVEYFKHNSDIESKLTKTSNILIPAIVIGELYFGAFKSGKALVKIAELDEFLKGKSILFCNDSTAFHYGKIKYKLQKKGKPIPDNDIWIAALALQYKLPLATRDKHFQFIEDLSVLAW